MKRIIFNQPAGLGDILFLMPLAKQYKEQGYEVLFPIASHYEDIQKHFPEVTFVAKELLNYQAIDSKKVQTIGNTIIIPFRWSDQFMKVPYSQVMRAKYDMVEADFNDWRKLTWKRDEEAELKLMYHLGLEDNQDFVLINENYSANMSIKILLQSEIKVVKFRPIQGYTMLDWGRVIERANEILTVHTSLQYMLEVMKLRTVPHIYVRKPSETSHLFYQYLFKKDYIWHS